MYEEENLWLAAEIAIPTFWQARNDKKEAVIARSGSNEAIREALRGCWKQRGNFSGNTPFLPGLRVLSLF